MAQIVENLKSFGIKCGRVWHSLKKPTMDEYKQVAKISAIGIGIFGLFGFLIGLIMQIFF